MGLKSSLEFYKQAKFLYKQISDVYDDFQSGKISDSQSDSVISRTLNDISRLNSMLSKINMQDFLDEYPKSTIDRTEENIDFYYDAADFIEKSLIAEKYKDSLYNGVRGLVKQLSPNEGDYKKYAHTEQELAKKFTAMLLHPNNINQFINQIKRMALGTMSRNEFKKIFYANKGKMQKLPAKHFESFEEYKDE